jgi:hypothetical protein
MAIEKVTFVDKIEALMESGIIQVRTVTRVVEDGVVLAEKFHRHTIAPDQDYSNESPEVQTACAALFTPERVAAYVAAKANANTITE